MINLLPDANELWRGIGGTFDVFIEVIGEILDNSIANIRGYKVANSIIIINIELTNDGVFVEIQDGGTGIMKIESALKLGDKSGQNDVLNEHGFGMKHSLASANPENDNWEILTRNREDAKKNRYRRVKAPYKFTKDEEILEEVWPSEIGNTGTIIRFKCTEAFFDTVKKGIGGKPGFSKGLDYLREDIGFLYADVIQDGTVNIGVKSKNIGYSEKVKAVTPNWVGFYKPKRGIAVVDLGGGEVKIQYIFGEIKEGDYAKYYKKNQSTSGCEIRINNRVFMSNEFKNIWNMENHPSYNHLLIQINVISDDPNRLPKTKTNKSGFRIGDEKYDNLLNWIRSTFPTPPKSLAGAVSERELIDNVADLKEKHLTGKAVAVKREFSVYNRIGCPVKVDLYVFDGSEIYLYEAKKDELEPMNVYQLKMYWDGAISDGLTPKKGILLATCCSDGVKKLIDELNTLKDLDGNYYNIKFKTWEEEGVEYPVR